MARLVYTRNFKNCKSQFSEILDETSNHHKSSFFLNLSLCFISIVLLSCNASRTATRLSNIGVLVKL